MPAHVRRLFLGVISQMTIRASRGVRLLVMAAMAWLGLALCAQAAHATYGKVTIVKINKGGERERQVLVPPGRPAVPTGLRPQGRRAKTFQVECNKDSQYGSCATWNNPKLTVTEKPTAGYELKNIKCVHEQGSGDWPKEPSKDSSQADGDTTVSGSTINLKVSFWEWVKCYVTNAPKPPDQHPAIKVVKDGPATAHSGDHADVQLHGHQPRRRAADQRHGDRRQVLAAHADGRHQRHDARSRRHVDLHVLVRHPVERGRRQPRREHGHDLRHASGRRRPPPAAAAPVCDTDQHSTTIVPPATPTQPAPPASPDTPATASGTAPASGQPPQIAVSPVRVRPGSATLRGPSGCPTTSAVAATVSGRRIVKVTFYVDNKKVKTLTQPNKSGGRWVLPMNVKRFAFGSHRVQARISSRAPARPSPGRCG